MLQGKFAVECSALLSSAALFKRWDSRTLCTPPSHPTIKPWIHPWGAHYTGRTSTHSCEACNAHRALSAVGAPAATPVLTAARGCPGTRAPPGGTSTCTTTGTTTILAVTVEAPAPGKVGTGQPLETPSLSTAPDGDVGLARLHHVLEGQGAVAVAASSKSSQHVGRSGRVLGEGGRWVGVDMARP